MIAQPEVLRAGAHSYAVGVPAAMRVCHIMTADLWAGAEVQLATAASYLITRPEVTLATILFNEGRLARELRTLGVKVAVIDERQHTAGGIVAFVTRFLKTHQIDIVHTHRYKDTVLGSVAAKLAGVPHVIRTVHGLPEPMRGRDRAKFQVYDALDKAALRCFADRIIAVSNDVADALRATGYRRTVVVPIHNGVDVNKVAATRARQDVRRELGIPSDALVIGTVGRLAPVKAQADLLRAAQRLFRKQENARFVIVGDGPMKDELASLAAQLGVERVCSFVGARQDCHEVIGAMDVFVLPSLHEGIPMALLEAMALGKPVVATAVGGIPEVVTDSVNGLLVPPRDDRALADACAALADNRAWAQRLGATARRTVLERFSHDASGAALVASYRSVVDGDPPRVPTTGADLSAPGLAWELTAGLLRITWRRGVRAIETRIARRRMHRVRSHPARLTAALRSARRILMVCHGNIIRSPFAATLVAQGVADCGCVSVASGGLAAVPGNPTHPTALQLATARSVDLSQHGASPLATQTVADSDVIFVMDVPQLVAMRRRFPEARGRTFLLTSLVPDVPLEIRDPVDGDESRFHACYDHIARAVAPIVGALRAAANSQ